MKNLYVIYKNTAGKTELKEVIIATETDKRFIIDTPGIDRKYVCKYLLEEFVDGYIFGYNKDVLITLWNNHQKANLGYLKKQLQEVKSLIVSDSLKAELLK